VRWRLTLAVGLGDGGVQVTGGAYPPEIEHEETIARTARTAKCSSRRVVGWRLVCKVG
jgi:hypothetical protein